MNSAEFSSRFTEEQEIGRDLTDNQLTIFFDNGMDVGVWREDRRTTAGNGEVLGTHTADMARYWLQKQGDEQAGGRPVAGPTP